MKTKIEYKTKSGQVKLTEQEYIDLSAKALADNRTFSEWSRLELLKALKK